MTVALILFAVAALGGVVLAGLRLAGRPLPIPLALVHGALAAAGLVALIVLLVHGATAGHLALSLLLFVIAALGGFFLFAVHLRNKDSSALPVPVVLLHGALAVAGFVILLLAALR
jgi:hypothetical protein